MPVFHDKNLFASVTNVLADDSKIIKKYIALIGLGTPCSLMRKLVWKCPMFKAALCHSVLAKQ
jgi:hypothetical protein